MGPGRFQPWPTTGGGDLASRARARRGSTRRSSRPPRPRVTWAGGGGNGAEHKRLREREDREPAGRGYSEGEVGLDLPSRHDAHELSERLEAEGVSHVTRWKYLLVGATDEDAAKAWEERLRKEAPEGTKVRVEATYAAVSSGRPGLFAVLGGWAGSA